MDHKPGNEHLVAFRTLAARSAAKATIIIAVIVAARATATSGFA